MRSSPRGDKENSAVPGGKRKRGNRVSLGAPILYKEEQAPSEQQQQKTTNSFLELRSERN